MFRRFVKALAVALLAAEPAGAAEVLTGNIPPFSIENGARPGFVREIVAEMAKIVGVDLPVVYKPWPQAQEEAKTRPDTLIYPLARTPSREAHYVWVQKIIDMEVAFATAPGKPKVENDAQARSLARIGVRDGSPMVKDLKDRGYANLVIVKSPQENATALIEGKIDAWYAPAPEIAFNWSELKLPGAPAYGLKLDSAPLYVAASKNSGGIDLDKWRAAFATLEKNGALARILAEYGLK